MHLQGYYSSGEYLNFTLEEIREMLIEEKNDRFLLNSLSIQKKLVLERAEQLQMIATAIDNTITTIENSNQVDWSNMLDLIHLTNMEQSLKNQYQNANNISARIRLHQNYSSNKQGWFSWIYEHLNIHSGMTILEIGCGNGALWTELLSSR